VENNNLPKTWAPLAIAQIIFESKSFVKNWNFWCISFM